MTKLARRTPLLTRSAVSFFVIGLATFRSLAAQQPSVLLPFTSVDSFRPEQNAVFPPIVQRWMPKDPVPWYTAAEWNYGVGLYRGQANDDQSPEVLVYPKDSILAATSIVVRDWLRTLNAGDVRGLQLDPYGRLYVIAGQDDQARRIFEKRLAIPGMTLADSAFTLSTAVHAFADANKPARILIAEEYMERLDALPKGASNRGASLWQFGAHRALSRAYFLSGNTAATIHHTKLAIALIPTLFFRSRIAFYGDGEAYLTLAELLLAAHDTVTLRRLDQQLLVWTKPPDSLVTEHPDFSFSGRAYANLFRRNTALVSMLYQPAPDVQGTSWLNAADTGAHTMRLDDGAIHLVGIGQLANAITILPAFRRLREQFTIGVQPIFLTPTVGYWGTMFVTPAQESANLRRYFTQTRPTKIPVAIWAGEKIRRPNGGLLPAPSPTVEAFRAGGLSIVAIVDQHGKIRHIFLNFGRDEERQAASLIKLLINEPRPHANSSEERS